MLEAISREMGSKVKVGGTIPRFQGRQRLQRLVDLDRVTSHFVFELAPRLDQVKIILGNIRLVGGALDLGVNWFTSLTGARVERQDLNLQPGKGTFLNLAADPVGRRPILTIAGHRISCSCVRIPAGATAITGSKQTDQQRRQ